MKRYLLFWLLATITVLSACSKSDDIQENIELGTIFTIQLPSDTTSTQTRATKITPTRYVMEVYNEDGKREENVIKNEAGKLVNHCESNTRSFTAYFDKHKIYTCIFWADYSDPYVQTESYDATELTNVTVNSGKEVSEAYYGRIYLYRGVHSPAIGVALKRAVAKVTLIEKDTLKADKNIVVTYTNNNSFNVLDELTGADKEELTATITTDKDKVSGRLGEFYMLSSVEGDVVNMSFKYDTEEAQIITNVPVKQNYNTNIKGEFATCVDKQFIVLPDEAWGGSENDVDKGIPIYEIGDLYPNAETPIGVVFYITNGGKSGKIVSLDQAQKSYSFIEEYTYAWSDSDAIYNLNKIKEKDPTLENYPGFKWCEDKNTPLTEGIYWYLPVPMEINLFDRRSGDNIIAINATLASINARLINTGTERYYEYISSREFDNFDCFTNIGLLNKPNGFYVRAVSKFNMK